MLKCVFLLANDTWAVSNGGACVSAATTPALFLALQCGRPSAGSERFVLPDLDEVLIRRGAPEVRRVMDRAIRRLELSIDDSQVSRTHARLQRVLGAWTLEDCGSKNGTILDGKPCARERVSDGAIFEVGGTMFVFRTAVLPTRDLTDAARALPGVATVLPELERAFTTLGQVAASKIPIVIHGPSGSGKEVAARAVHVSSGRAGPFVAVNCGAIAPTLVESELFGSKKGAFSGAVEDRPGLVRAADRGTLFLDEIGDLPLAAQVAFLRVLQEGEVLPVGGARSIPVDFRVVAASHRDLVGLVAAGQFREDLFARLAGLTLRLPPLRERREDLGLLLAALLPRHTERAVTLQVRVGRALLNHGWPLNVRELDRVLQMAVVLAAARVPGNGPMEIQVEDLPESMLSPDAESPPARQADDRDLREQLVKLLGEHDGNLSAVARALGKHRTQVTRLLERFGLKAKEYRGG
jgi:transcriptional regulator of acetoin/glycerol metabolism